ncbi:hypothetical protein MRB53_037313 [Persea americana]|nr:hypothetical protein MRB53_037313 [Persea americana]
MMPGMAMLLEMCFLMLSVLHNDRSHQQSSDSLQHDEDPDDPIVACEEAYPGNPASIFGQCRDDERGEHGQKRQLHIPEPDGHGRPRTIPSRVLLFESLFEEHAAQARHGTRSQDGVKAESRLQHRVM